MEQRDRKEGLWRARRWRQGALVALSAVVAALTVGGAPVGAELLEPAALTSTRPAPTSVVLITVDTLRADALGFAGNKAVSTPTIDRLAGAGRWFSNARAHAVTTLPSHTTLLTGLLPTEHGVRDNGYRFDGRAPTLGSLLQQKGFSTAAFVAAFPLDRRFGLDVGFDVYDGKFEAAGIATQLKYTERPGSEVVGRALDWWQQQRGKPRFLWVHLFEPHAPYVPLPEFQTSYAKRPYLGEIASTDRILEPLLDPILESAGGGNTLVVLTSDHGESLGQHGELTHGLFAYDATLAVPLVLWGGGVPPGEDDRVARHIDVMPTILEAVGAVAPSELPGRSLLKPATGQETSYFEALSGALNYGFAPLRGVVKDGHKLIDLPLPEFYDLSRTPRERENLIQPRAVYAAEMRKLLPTADTAWFDELPEVDSEVARGLASLGYLSGRVAIASSYSEADDPKNWIHLERLLDRAVRLDARGQYAEEIRILRQVLGERPNIPTAIQQLALAQLKMDDFAAALQTMEEAYRDGLASEDLKLQLALTWTEFGRTKEALEILRPLAAKYPEEPSILNPTGLALAISGQFEPAYETFSKSLRIDPERVATHENLSFVALSDNKPEEAKQHARRAVELDPNSMVGWRNLGQAALEAGDGPTAVRSWRTVLELSPNDSAALFQLGMYLASVGERDESKKLIGRFLESSKDDQRFAAERARARQVGF